MDKNLQIIDYVINYVDGRTSRLDLVQRIYIDNNFTKRQKKACEIFLFEPNKKNAIRAIEITPKAWFFLKKFTCIHEDIFITIDKVLVSTRKKSYVKELIRHKNLFDLLEKLQKSSSNDDLVRQIKTIIMEKKLDKNINNWR
ncbi:hypothetical protein ACFSCX_00345 [Bacillus salitolerans]|uniref:IDEAL domain-containing protein n=1 Tax=Bacillus salitolerans TaxID=1437434 RepID=A0ABW4LIS9_9BACI